VSHRHVHQDRLHVLLHLSPLPHSPDLDGRLRLSRPARDCLQDLGVHRRMQDRPLPDGLHRQEGDGLLGPANFVHIVDFVLVLVLSILFKQQQE
jgi:hypothetical protein